jgi:hypothetical protein
MFCGFRSRQSLIALDAQMFLFDLIICSEGEGSGEDATASATERSGADAGVQTKESGLL